MAYVIALPCVGVKDTACVAVCPCDCIHPTKDASCVEACPVDCIHAEEADPQYYIDPDTCIDCALCVDECPVKAIFPQDDLPAEWRDFVEKNAAWYRR